jgi:hypothetical protein
MVQPNRIRYLQSLSDELLVQATRIRDLIGDKHWLSDGHHKEYLLLSVLNRHLPTGVIASRGFIVSPYLESNRSTEQDILVVDTTQEAPLFQQGGLLITFPKYVLAAISVKTKLSKKEVIDAIKGLDSARNVISSEPNNIAPWFGAFFFNASRAVATRPEVIYNYLASSLRTNKVGIPSRPCIDALACAGTHLCRIMVRQEEHNNSHSVLNGFHCNGQATALFFGHLLDHIAIKKGANEAQFLSSLDSVPVEPFSVPRYEMKEKKKARKGTNRGSR